MITRTFFFIGFLCLLGRQSSFAGQNTPIGHNAPGDDLTISYNLTVTAKKGNTGIGETYNGGIETLFVGAGRARLRLASLMRIQSVFVFSDKGQLKKVTLLKESGADKKRTVMTADQWTKYNEKYAGLVCRITKDTATILHYTCKKALVTLRDGRELTIWYTTAINSPAFAWLEPAFVGVPGLVLRYEYVSRKKTLRYTATAITRKPIDPAVFNDSGQ